MLFLLPPTTYHLPTNTVLTRARDISRPTPCKLHRFIQLAPLNARYEALAAHMAAAGLLDQQQQHKAQQQQQQHGAWDKPLILPGCAGAVAGSSNGVAGASARAAARPGAALAAAAPAPPGSPLQTHRPSSGGGSSGGGAAAGVATAGSPFVPAAVSLLPPEDFTPLVVPFRWA